MNQDVFAEVYIITALAIILAFILMIFFYPEGSVEFLRNIFQTFDDMRWKEVTIFLVFSILLVIIAIAVVLTYFNNFIPEREV